MSGSRTPSLAHVVYRTRRFEQMLAWYKCVFGASVQHQNPAKAFLTYDDEHHRLAFIDLSVVQPNVKDADKHGLVGVEHIAYTYRSLEDLFENYPPQDRWHPALLEHPPRPHDLDVLRRP